MEGMESGNVGSSSFSFPIDPSYTQLNQSCNPGSSIEPCLTNTNQAFLRDYWAEKKRVQRTKERDQCTSLSLQKSRSSKNVCAAMARYWRSQTKGLPINDQKEVFQQLLHHPTFSELQNSRSSNNVERMLLSNVRNTLTELKVPHSKNELFVKRASLMMIMNNADGTTSVNHSKIASVLGVHRRNIAAASSRLETKDEDEVLPLTICQRQLPKGNIITNELRDLVYAFWTSQTRVSPNKKDICRKRVGRKSVVQHPVHLLDDSQVPTLKSLQSHYTLV